MGLKSKGRGRPRCGRRTSGPPAAEVAQTNVVGGAGMHSVLLKGVAGYARCRTADHGLPSAASRSGDSVGARGGGLFAAGSGWLVLVVRLESPLTFIIAHHHVSPPITAVGHHHGSSSWDATVQHHIAWPSWAIFWTITLGHHHITPLCGHNGHNVWRTSDIITLCCRLGAPPWVASKSRRRATSPWNTMIGNHR